MLNDPGWVLVDTETNGLKLPIVPIEIAAQHMEGWTPVGGAFRCLINQNTRISPEASRVNGFTREILERDGMSPEGAYDAFFEYAGNRPIASYNLAFDYDKILMPEWDGLGIEDVPPRGFCALRLTQRLLDPSPAGNCKLQTLRQYYRLPERGAHTARGDVETTADLLGTVLRPIAKQRGLDDWNAIVALTEEQWYPTRLPFGKFKGKNFRDAATDTDLMAWLEWLSMGKRAEYRAMGLWYLDHLDRPTAPSAAPVHDLTQEGSASLAIYADPEAPLLRQAIATAQERLAEVEAEYTLMRQQVAFFEGQLFLRVGELHRQRARLRLKLAYLEAMLDALPWGDEGQQDQVHEEYRAERDRTERRYDNARNDAENRKKLAEEDQERLNALFKRLVRLYHPDTQALSPEKRKSYQDLMSSINNAKDRSDLAVLEDIAHNPEKYLHEDNTPWSLNDDLAVLRRLYDDLVADILSIMEEMEELRNSAHFELSTTCHQDPRGLEDLASKQAAELRKEIAELEARIIELEDEINKYA